jgi:hypothetical protein
MGRAKRGIQPISGFDQVLGSRRGNNEDSQMLGVKPEELTPQQTLRLSKDADLGLRYVLQYKGEYGKNLLPVIEEVVFDAVNSKYLQQGIGIDTPYSELGLLEEDDWGHKILHTRSERSSLTTDCEKTAHKDNWTVPAKDDASAVQHCRDCGGRVLRTDKMRELAAERWNDEFEEEIYEHMTAMMAMTILEDGPPPQVEDFDGYADDAWSDMTAETLARALRDNPEVVYHILDDAGYRTEKAEALKRLPLVAEKTWNTVMYEVISSSRPDDEIPADASPSQHLDPALHPMRSIVAEKLRRHLADELEWSIVRRR